MPNFNDRLGFKLASDGLGIELHPTTEHEVMPGVVHFAVLATLAEVSAAHSTGVAVVPAQVSLQLLRRAGTAPLVGRGRLLKSGRTLMFAEGEVFQNDELVAKAVVTFARV